ncbi:MAG: hypothetical protein KDH09_15920 [Chrysiogenetes bacterium]|nr:hypothetical protein [Chrysiogenetes bacterium]
MDAPLQDDSKVRPWQKRALPYAVVALACIAARLPFLSVPMIVDEGAYGYVAKFWTSHYQLYRDIPFDRPQGLFLIFKLCLLLIGGTLQAIRFYAALWTAAGGVTLFLLLERAHSRRAAWFGALGFAVLSTCVRVEGYTANGETFANFPLLLSALLTWQGSFGWAGFAAGGASFIKPSGASGLILAMGWALTRPEKRKNLALSAAGFAFWPLASIIHGALADWGSYWHIMVTFRGALTDALGLDVAEQLRLMRLHIRTTFPAWAPAFAAGSFAVFRASRPQRNFGLLFAASALAGMAIGARWADHYFIQWVAPMCFLGGIGAATIQGPREDRIAALAIAAALLVFAFGEGPYWLMSPKEVSETYYERDAYTHGPEIAAFVRAHTRPEDSIYVAFSNAHLYYLADRRAAPPLLFWLYPAGSAEFAAQVMDAVEARVPAAIIVTHPVPGPYLKTDEFWKALRSGYEEAFRQRLICVYLRKGDKPASEAGSASSP